MKIFGRALVHTNLQQRSSPSLSFEKGLPHKPNELKSGIKLDQIFPKSFCCPADEARQMNESQISQISEQKHVIWLTYRNSGREFGLVRVRNINVTQRKHQMKSMDTFGIFPHHLGGLEERFMEVYSGSRVRSACGPRWTRWLRAKQLFWHCCCKETVYHWRQERARARDLGFKP